MNKQKKYSMLPRTVVSIKHGRIRRFSFGKPQSLSSHKMPAVLIEQTGLSASYLEIFLDEPFPLFPNLNCSILLKSWHIILDLAKLLFAPLIEPEEYFQNEVNDLALMVRHNELAFALSSSIRMSTEDATSIINFLTFHPKTKKGERGHRGLWSAPLIAVPQTDLIALPLPALTASNPLRKCEAWLERGGIRDDLKKSARGLTFEAAFRDKIFSAITKNALLTDTRSSQYSIQKTGDFDEEIDILLQVGAILFVGEIKFHLTPCEAQEEKMHADKLRLAADQVLRKADLLQNRRDKIASVLDISPDKAGALTIIPLIIDSQGYGLGSAIKGVRITEANYLLTCLGAGTLATSASWNPSTGATMTKTVTFYRNQNEAEQAIQKLLSDPPTLRRYIDRAVWSEIPFPTSFGTNIWPQIVTLGDVVGSEREDAEYMTDAIV